MTPSATPAPTNKLGPPRRTSNKPDFETGNEYIRARYYASEFGRWLSPDWSAKVEPVPYAKLSDPQSLNLYGYMLDSPLDGVDPNGHDFWDKLNNFLHDRGWHNTPPPPPPAIKAPPPPHWQYQQSNGSIDLKIGTQTILHAGTGYSGHGAGYDNPKMQRVRNVGPIPRGKWRIGRQKNHEFKGPRGSTIHLWSSMLLHPLSGTNTYGRFGFLMHGSNGEGNHSSSDGCIVACPRIRDTVGGSGIFRLTVVR